jgi:hypothetical protein
LKPQGFFDDRRGKKANTATFLTDGEEEQEALYY